MSREVKMVKEGFAWPLRTIWEGYLNPFNKHAKQCPFCEGSGYNEETKKIKDDWYGFYDQEKKWCYKITQDEVDALVEAGRLMDFTHIFTNGNWIKKDPEYKPIAAEVNEWAKIGFGHDAINCMICVEARAKRLGVWGENGLCEHCGGSGEIWLNEKYKKMAEEWVKTEPPKGDWYQMWETTSEGSPLSPAFKTKEELARWLVDNKASSFGSSISTYEQWMKMIDAKWCISMATKIDDNGNIKIMSGVDAV